MSSNMQVVKAFVATDWKSYGTTGCLMTLQNLDGLVETPKKLRITFRIQKNRRNGQKSLLPLMISTHTFAPFSRHIGCSFKLRDSVQLTTNRWVFIWTTKASWSIWLGAKLQSCSSQSPKQVIQTWQKKRYCVSLPILEEFGLLSYSMRLGWTLTLCCNRVRV